MQDGQLLQWLGLWGGWRQQKDQRQEEQGHADQGEQERAVREDAQQVGEELLLQERHRQQGRWE